MKIITDFRVICNENVSTSERGNGQVKTCSLNLFSARRFPAFKPHYEILDGCFFKMYDPWRSLLSYNFGCTRDQ